MREWQHRLGCTTQSCRHAGNDFNRHACRAACLNLFAAAPENKRIATLQSHHQIASLRLGNQNRIDALLRHGMFAAAFGDGYQPGVRIDQCQHPIIHQPIMHHDFGRREEARRFDRQQIRIARACAYKYHPALLYFTYGSHNTQMEARRPGYNPKFIGAGLVQLCAPTSRRPMPIDARAVSSSVETTG